MKVHDERPVRRREQAGWRREQLLNAAMSVFGSKGVEAASTREVAAAAGVTPGLLYHYFESKEALAVAVIAERGFLPELRQLLSESIGHSATTVLPQVLSDFSRLLAGHAELVALFFSGAISNKRIREGLKVVVAEGQQLLADYLAARVIMGELREHDTTAAAQMLLASVVLGQVVGFAVDPVGLAGVLVKGLAAQGAGRPNPEGEDA
jgi:AcrR family transcriptional regulator